MKKFMIMILAAFALASCIQEVDDPREDTSDAISAEYPETVVPLPSLYETSTASVQYGLFLVDEFIVYGFYYDDRDNTITLSLSDGASKIYTSNVIDKKDVRTNALDPEMGPGVYFRIKKTGGKQEYSCSYHPEENCLVLSEDFYRFLLTF